jgi:rhamnose transport system permease protein
VTWLARLPGPDVPREAGLVGFVAVLVACLAVSSGAFLTTRNLNAVFLDIAIVTVLALGLLLVILTRNLDLSLGSVLGLSAVCVALFLRDNPGTPLVVAVLLGIGVGLTVGAINGFFVAYLEISSIIFTLAMLSIVRGLVYLVNGHTTVSAEDVPDSLLNLAGGSYLGVLPRLFLIALVLAVVVAAFLHGTRSGRGVYAAGSNPTAARLHGLPVRRTVFGAFLVSGALAGLAGVLFLSRFGFSDFTAGTGYELTVLAVVVIGGASIFGGSGSVLGVVLGALLLGVITNGFAVLDITVFWQNVVLGGLILLALVVDGRVRAVVLRPRRGVDAEAAV